VDIVNVQLFGYGAVHDFTSDKIWKTAVALFSVAVGLLYAYLHKKVKGAISAKREKAATPSP
ncbi:MAG: hypothetical protein MJ067_03305, partial [Oscillospiraceae bacterium]|nr:hypothetical protein [Oscillospiraceae bacterium]